MAEKTCGLRQPFHGTEHDSVLLYPPSSQGGSLVQGTFLASDAGYLTLLSKRDNFGARHYRRLPTGPLATRSTSTLARICATPCQLL